MSEPTRQVRRFSDVGRSLEADDEIRLVSVGVDIGSSTSHLVFSRIVMEPIGNRYHVIERTILHESDVLLTPYTDESDIDADRLGRFIDQQYQDAGIEPEEIDTGALILTGVAVRRRNSRAIGDLFASQAGKFVSVSAGDALETTLVAFGSGAADRSMRTPSRAMNVDIGGGTAKIAVCEHGELVGFTAIDVGARVVSLDGSNRVLHLEEAGKRFAAEVGRPDLAPGDILSDSEQAALAERMADRLFEAMGASTQSAETAALLRLDPMPDLGRPDTLSFSGGVSEYLYGREAESYGDLGPQLAAAVRKRASQWGVKLVPPEEGLRATVVGASQYTIQVSGSTIFVDPTDTLPLRNVPVVAPTLPIDEDELNPMAIADAIRLALRAQDLDHGDQPVALCFRWGGSASFRRLGAFCEGVAQGMKNVLAGGVPLVLVNDGDIGGLIGLHMADNMSLNNPLVSIDGIRLRAFDFIDVGAMLASSGAVPVVIKSLVFPTTGALGRADTALA